MVERKTKKLLVLLLLLCSCGSGGDEACSNVAVVGDNSQATCNGNNTQQNGSGDLMADQAADICCTQEKVDSLMDDDCLKEIGFSDTELCRADSGTNDNNNTTLDFN